MLKCQPCCESVHIGFIFIQTSEENRRTFMFERPTVNVSFGLIR
jgi:hypothetical protein